MRPLEHIHDADTLRQIAVLQQRQIEILAERLQAIQRRIDEAKAEEAQLVFLSEIGRLEQQVAKLEQRAFGDSSERRQSSRSATDEPADPARGHGPRQQSLPIEEQVHVLPEGERGCPSCGGELDEWAGQYEDGDEITVEMRTFKIVRHRRQKYRCGCNGAVVTAPGPRKLIAGPLCQDSCRPGRRPRGGREVARTRSSGAGSLLTRRGDPPRGVAREDAPRHGVAGPGEVCPKGAEEAA